MEHELKTWPMMFQAIKNGKQMFEIRKNDRNFMVGEILCLKEYNPESEEYSGAEILVEITYIAGGADLKLILDWWNEDYVAMSIRRVD